MLKLVNDPSGKPYLADAIDGAHENKTQQAINAFQTDHGADAVPIAAGVISPGGHAVTTLAGMLPANRRDLRALSGQSVVYLGQPTANATAAAAAIRTHASLRTAFRGRVADLVTRMHNSHGIAMSLTPTGARRTFAEQAVITPPASYAGPGESNHNYGMAVDIGFNGLEWLLRDGRVERDNHWFEPTRESQ